jgi:enediyne biosynthesis protein E4
MPQPADPRNDTSPDLLPGENEGVADDEIIGVAFRWSMAVFALIGLGAAAFWFWSGNDPVDPKIESREGRISTLADKPRNLQPPAFDWKNIAPDCGIDFVHFSGATGERLLPETLGGGVAIFDYDKDNLPDVLFISGTTWPHNAGSGQPKETLSSIRLYQNLGKAQFREVTRESGLDCQLCGMGCAVGDFDDDGWLDLYVTCVGTNRLFRNDKGKFADVTDAAGVAGGEDDWSTAAGFFDYNRDGHLDLLVCNYVQWNRELDFEVNFTLNGSDRAYGPPTHYRGSYPRLYQSRGDGTFEERTEQAGLKLVNPDQDVPLAKTLGLLTVDLNEDGWDDIVVANDTVRNQCFVNQHDGTFREIAAQAGLAYDRMGNSTGAMGIDIAHPWNNSSRAIAIGNFANEMSSVYVSRDKNISYVDQAAALGIGAPTRQRLSFGTLWEDFDLDGRVDFLQVNGHLEDTITEIQPSQTHRQAAQLFWNNGASSGVCFSLVDPASADDLYQPVVGRGAASGDLDGDGKVDLVLTQIDGPPLVLLNQCSARNRYLRVRLVGGKGVNYFAFGAVVQADTGKAVATRYLTPTRSYLSQIEPVLSFGFPAGTTTIARLTVRWPDGTVQELKNVETDQTLSLSR